MELSTRDDVVVTAINYKDEPENARRFLGLLGNPFAAVGGDRDGRTAVNWGVYGVPETFIVDGTGTILHKHVGPLTEAALKNDILPAIAAAAAK
jgi:cytochrome c biogenesis protein CcmG/thiol:disulfide interchange protein DsbE